MPWPGAGEFATALGLPTNSYTHPELRFLVPFELFTVSCTRAAIVLTAPFYSLHRFAILSLFATRPPLLQVLSACGGAVIVFQFLLYPQIVARIGPTRSQRWTCCVAIPSFFAYPFLSRLHDSKCMLAAASLIVLFVTSMAGNVVSATPFSVSHFSLAHIPYVSRMLVRDVDFFDRNGYLDHCPPSVCYLACRPVSRYCAHNVASFDSRTTPTKGQEIDTCSCLDLIGSQSVRATVVFMTERRLYPYRAFILHTWCVEVPRLTLFW